MDEGVDVRQGPAATGKGTRNSGTVELVFGQMGWHVRRELLKRMAGVHCSRKQLPAGAWDGEIGACHFIPFLPNRNQH